MPLGDPHVINDVCSVRSTCRFGARDLESLAARRSSTANNTPYELGNHADTSRLMSCDSMGAHNRQLCHQPGVSGMVETCCSLIASVLNTLSSAHEWRRAASHSICGHFFKTFHAQPPQQLHLQTFSTPNPITLHPNPLPFLLAQTQPLPEPSLLNTACSHACTTRALYLSSTCTPHPNIEPCNKPTSCILWQVHTKDSNTHTDTASERLRLGSVSIPPSPVTCVPFPLATRPTLCLGPYPHPMHPLPRRRT